ncbi:glycosyltransferase [Actinomadura geliboluensis]|uniref:Glycosyltransferase family 1 protein n=1 Tax=Actinomadura geliboluensis TaxID=882440 RepID=A0A5S4GCU2_9ACTN|nr:glycosyltransferase [Actinomadura geliboluensis]TMR30816.1 glycosyltransferase family 1 protein [Actinomadura geliboluensis]
MTQRRASARRVQVPSILGDPGIQRARTPERRFLFAMPPLAGYIAPAAAVAAELGRRGHKVAWAGHRPTLEALLRPGSRIFSAAGDDCAAMRDRWLERRGLDALRLLWDDFLVPLGDAMMPGVEQAADRFRPDAVVADQFVLAAPVAARRRELPWATLAASPAEFTRPLAALPEAEEEVRDRIGDFQLDHGIDDLIDLRFSDHLTLVFATSALVGDTSFFPDHFAFVGPAPGRSAPCAFPWEWLDGRPAVLVSLGRIAGPSATGFLRAAAEAVRGMDVQAVVEAPPGGVPEPPPNVLVRERVPRGKLLERLSAVVCHGGHATVCASLAHGHPLVVAPVRGDQPVIASRVEAAGAGVTVGFEDARPEELRAALAAVLADGGPHRAAAEAARETFAAAGGAAAAADRLEKLT